MIGDGRMHSRFWLVVLVGFLVAVMVASAVAQTATPAPKPRQACAADIKQLCATVQPGGGRIAQCMKSNADKLSPGCRDSLQAAQAARAKKPAQ